MHVCYFIVFLAALAGALGYDDGCLQYQLSCRDDRTCIRMEKWCDGRKDCQNGYDEYFCKMSRDENRCPSDFLPCAFESGYGCLPLKARCDGYSTCKYGEDERNCESSAVQNRDSDTRQPPNVLDNVEDYDHDYENDDTNYSDEETSALKWVLNQRKDFTWGEDTERAIVALSFSTDGHLGCPKTEMLMVKCLHLRISLALARNWHKTLLSRRALLIYALTASCGNPRDFYGFNLVEDLRGSANQLHAKYRPVAPIVYLTLCLTNMSTTGDIDGIRREADKLTPNSKNDLKALFLLTIVCMEERKIDNRYSEILGWSKRSLVKNLITSDAENVYELALVTQALNAARVNPKTWDRKEKMKLILKQQDKEGSFIDMLATYYVMPLLTGNSLLSVGRQCPGHMTQNDSSSMDTLGSKIEGMKVNYTLNFGPQKVSQTMFLSVSNGSTIYDAMSYAEKKSKSFRFSLDDKKSSDPLVYSIGGIPNDAERGLFWSVEVDRDQRYKSTVANIKTYNLMNGDRITFSMKGDQN